MLPEPLEPLPAPVPAPGLVQLSSLSLHPSLVCLWQGWLGIDGSEVLAEREGANPGSLKRASGKLGMGPGPRSLCHSFTASLSSAQGCWAFLWQENHSPGQRCPPPCTGALCLSRPPPISLMVGAAGNHTSYAAGNPLLTPVTESCRFRHAWQPPTPSATHRTPQVLSLQGPGNSWVYRSRLFSRRLSDAKSTSESFRFQKENP